MVITRYLTFHMSIPWNKTFLWVPNVLTLWPWRLIFLLKTLTLAIPFECYVLGLWLIDYLRFYVPLNNFSLIRAKKFRPMFGAQGLWAGKDLYRATPAVTRDLGFSGLIRRTAPFSRLYDTRGDVKDLFQPGSSRGSRALIFHTSRTRNIQHWVFVPKMQWWHFTDFV
jgi:hypothetical protein